MISDTDSHFLKSIPAFSSVDEILLNRLVSSGTTEEVPAEAMLFQQGQLPEYLFVLLSGMVALTSVTRNNCTTVDILKPVEQFQLSAVLLAAPYLLSAQTLQPSRLLRVHADAVRRIVESEPALALASARYLSSQYRNALREVVHLKLRSVTQRLATYLLSLASDGGEIRLPFGKRRLASRLGASPEHLSRAFAILRKYGVTTRGSRVAVTDAEALASFAAANAPAIALSSSVHSDASGTPLL